jgi:hypothetical protein
MKRLARMSLPNGRVLMPADTAYERELFFEQVAYRVRRDPQVAVELDDRSWIVSRVTAHGSRCAPCGAPLHGLAFADGGTVACRRCVGAALDDRGGRLGAVLACPPTGARRARAEA